jgi:two-component system, chemotaxis family, chemotaxis protein CheY
MPMGISLMPKALVVDDSKAIRMILSRTLAELGYEVVQAANGVAALEILRASGTIDLVMADWNMPEMDGLELLTRVRGDASYDGVKIIMVTTESEVEQMSAALAAGANEYVMKPFTKEILIDKLRLAALPA